MISIQQISRLNVEPTRGEQTQNAQNTYHCSVNPTHPEE